MRSSGKCSFQHSKTSLAEFNGELSDFPTVLSIGVVQKPPASVHVVLNSDCVWFYRGFSSASIVIHDRYLYKSALAFALNIPCDYF